MSKLFSVKKRLKTEKKKKKKQKIEKLNSKKQRKKETFRCVCL